MRQKTRKTNLGAVEGILEEFVVLGLHSINLGVVLRLLTLEHPQCQSG